jgi:hypothetical protein
MQINSKFVALGLTTVMFAATAYAMAPGDHEWFERFDTDRNGQFSPAEIDSALSQMFARADSNRDGRLTLDEARAFHGAHSDHPGPGRLDGDANRDGFLTLAEFQARARDHLTRADADHNGQLSMSEVEAMHGEAHGHR